MPRNDKFPSPTEVARRLTDEESTSMDVLYESQKLFNLANILSTCETDEDIRTYVNRLKSIANKFKSSLPDDTAMKYFYFGVFSAHARIVSEEFDKLMHTNLHNINEE
ncbi:MAG: hypothetical protein NC548_55730 [Lachnospiraceae bacterium]|nr:hypothetical protein [Lachnospiraceae bacterium]